MKFEISLDFPHRDLSPNSRGHWSKGYKARKKQFEMTHAACLEAGVHRHKFSKDQKYKIHWQFFPPNRRRRDDDNMLASMKAARDAIANCMKIDDHNFRSSHEVCEPMFAPCVVVTLEPTA